MFFFLFLFFCKFSEEGLEFSLFFSLFLSFLDVFIPQPFFDFFFLEEHLFVLDT
jgi:hypothetical protein